MGIWAALEGEGYNFLFEEQKMLKRPLSKGSHSKCKMTEINIRNCGKTRAKLGRDWGAIEERVNIDRRRGRNPVLVLPCLALLGVIRAPCLA